MNNIQNYLLAAAWSYNAPQTGSEAGRHRAASSMARGSVQAVIATLKAALIAL